MNWRRLKDVLDPTLTTRLWTASGSTWYGGEQKSFWRKRKAFDWAKQNMHYNFVKVINELTGERFILKTDERTPIMDMRTSQIIGFVEDKDDNQNKKYS
jgi:hypothetical protein